MLNHVSISYQAELAIKQLSNVLPMDLIGSETAWLALETPDDLDSTILVQIAVFIVTRQRVVVGYF